MTVSKCLDRGMEALWLLTVLLVPLVFLDRDYVKSEAVIGYVEVPKIALLRLLACDQSTVAQPDIGVRCCK